ncbi:MAG TPA: TerB family tellurite resistance protein [Candidatus Limnocylindrales bacterium]
MSFLTRTLGLDNPASPELPVDPHAPLPSASEADTASVKLIALQLSAMPPARARYLAAFAYLLGRAADANMSISDDETAEMVKLMEDAGGLDPETARLVVVLATAQADSYGATEDFLVTREFKAISTVEEREQLLRCCFLVMAADDEIDETESWLANRLAEELDIERPDLNEIRNEFYDQLSSVREIRRFAAN